MERETGCAYGTPRMGRELSHEVTRPQLRAEQRETERLPEVNDVRQLPRPQKPLLCICRSVRHTPPRRFQRKRFRVSLQLESEQVASKAVWRPMQSFLPSKGHKKRSCRRGGTPASLRAVHSGRIMGQEAVPSRGGGVPFLSVLTSSTTVREPPYRPFPCPSDSPPRPRRKHRPCLARVR